MKVFGIIVVILLFGGLTALVIWQGIKLVKDIIAFVRKKKVDKKLTSDKEE